MLIASTCRGVQWFLHTAVLACYTPIVVCFIYLDTVGTSIALKDLCRSPTTTSIDDSGCESPSTATASKPTDNPPIKPFGAALGELKDV